MANLENNNENLENENQSLPEKVGKAVGKTVEDTKELVKDVVENPVEVAEEFAEQAAKDVTDVKWWARLLQYVFWIGLFLVTAFIIIINLNVTKQWAALQALQVLNQDFKAKMTTKSIHVDYFGDVTVKGLKIQDYRGLEFITAEEFRANSNWIALASNAISKKNNHLSFDALQLTKADIKVITYKGDSISNFIRYVNNFDTKKPSDPNKPPFQLNSRVQLVDSKVSIINENSEGDAGRWLVARNVNLLAPTVKVNGTNVSAQVNNMSFRTTRWGKEHFVDTFSADIALTDDFLSLKDLTLNTDHSLLQGNVKFNLNNGSWADFTNRVRWEMDLKRGSQLSGYDISYFVTDWDNYKPINISGQLNGPLNNFHLRNFVMGNRDVSIATGTMKLTNLLDGKFVIETNNLSTDFTYVGLKQMMPTFISTKMKNFADDFGRLRFNGAVRVMPEQVFVPKGNLITGIGQADITNFYLDDYSTTMPKYKGYAEVRDLNAKAITKMPEVGLITGNINFDGRSFDVEQMVVKARADIASIDILDKKINNVYLDGLLDHRTYRGIIHVKDEQVNADVDGFIDFKTSKISADVLADIRHLNLNYFTGQSGNQIISGQFDGTLAMSSLNDLNLDAAMKGISFTNGSQRYNIPEADLKVYFTNGNRVVEVDAPGAINGRIAGDYQLEDLSGMIQNGLQKILVGPPPRRLYRGQSFNMEFDVKQGLVNYFEPNVKIPSGARISGSYDGDSNNLVLNADAASLTYIMTKAQDIADANRAMSVLNPTYDPSEQTGNSKDSALVSNVLVRINTANLDEQIFAKVDRLEYNQNILKDITLTGRNENNQILHIAANFLHGTPDDELNGDLKAYAVNLNQSFNSAGDYVVRFEPTEVQIHNTKWQIDTSPELNHSITYRKKTGDFLIENLRIFSGDSSLMLRNAVFKSAKDFQAAGDVKNFQVAKLLDMQKGGNDMDIQGVANGTFDFRMSQNNLEPLVDLTVDNITMGGKDMGNIMLSAKNSSTPNVFEIDGKVISAGIIGENNLHVTGTINNNPSVPTLDIKADMKDFDLAFTQEFVKGVFGNMRGKANGILSITGPMNSVDYSGDIALNDLGLRLNFTGVDYQFEDTVIPLSRGLAILNDVQVKDGRANSKGSISGVIRFETLASMGMDLIMRADNLMVLNTQQRDYDLFWGRVYGQGNLYVSGPVTGLSISTDLNEPFRALNNSVFTFNAGSTSGVDEFKMLRFLKEDESGAVVLEDRKRDGVNMTLDFNVAVDKGTTVNVMLPEDVGDISVRGNADPLRFRMFPNGNITMNGSYIVDSGTFVSKAVLERTFQIARGSSMRWDGDAMTPALDITANYLRTVTNAGQYLGVTTLPPVNVMLSVDIGGTLNSPELTLGVSAPDLSGQLKETLAGKMSNEDDKVIQFGSILVLSNFNVQDAGGFDFGNINELVGSQVGNLAFKQLGSVFNTISNEVQVDLNYLRGDEASNTGDRANASVSFALSPRVNVKTGLGVPISRTENTGADYLSGEGIIEYDWSKKNDGTRLVRVYSKPSNIGLVAGGAANSTANQTYGVGVVYSKSFNTLFKRKKKKAVKDSSIVVIDSVKIDSIQ